MPTAGGVVLAQSRQARKELTNVNALRSQLRSSQGLDPSVGFYQDHLALGGDRNVTTAAVRVGLFNFPKSFGVNVSLEKSSGLISRSWNASVTEATSDNAQLQRAAFENLGTGTSR